MGEAPTSSHSALLPGICYCQPLVKPPMITAPTTKLAHANALQDSVKMSRALSIFVAPKVISEACLHSGSGLHYRFCLRERSVYTRLTKPSEAASGP